MFTHGFDKTAAFDMNKAKDFAGKAAKTISTHVNAAKDYAVKNPRKTVAGALAVGAAAGAAKSLSSKERE